LDYVWLNGPISANFHPNTNAQAIVANEIIAAFNTRYHTGIAPLTATEMLGGLLKKTTNQIDMTFAAWMTGFGLTGLTGSDDSDGDGVSATVEFALGLNPTLRDSHKITSALVDNNGIPALELAYPIRLPVSSHYALAPASSVDLTSPFIPLHPLCRPADAGHRRHRPCPSAAVRSQGIPALAKHDHSVIPRGTRVSRRLCLAFCRTPWAVIPCEA
jgi:hypothetical protein